MAIQNLSSLPYLPEDPDNPELLTALALLPGDSAPLYARVTAYTNSQDYEKAIAVLYELIHLSGEDPALYYQIALREEARGDAGKAAEALQKVLELDPGFMDAREKLDTLRQN